MDIGHEAKKDLLWRLNRWYGLIGVREEPEKALDEMGDYLDYLQGRTRRRPPIKSEVSDMTKRENDKSKSKKEDDADIAQTKKNLQDMAEEVKRRDQAISDDPGR